LIHILDIKGIDAFWIIVFKIRNKIYSIYNWGFDFGTSGILMLLGIKLTSLSL